MGLTTFDHISSGSVGTATSITVAHTLGSGKNRILFACVSSYNKDPATPKYGGSGGTAFTSLYDATNFTCGFYIVPNADSGAKNIYASQSGDTYAVMVVSEWYNAYSVRSAGVGSSTGGYPSNITPQATGVVIGDTVVSLCGNWGASSGYLTPTQTDRGYSAIVYAACEASDTVATATTQTMTWSSVGNYGSGAAIAVALEPMAAGYPQIRFF